MRTYLDCIPCFFKQAVEMARLVTGDELVHKKILDEFAKIVPDIPFNSPPPETARMIQHLMEKYTGEADFYRHIKAESNRRALALYPRLKEKVRDSDDRLLTAVEIAIAGNVIDYAAKNTLNIEAEIERLFTEEFSATGKTKFHFEDFKADLSRARRVLYLADNAGEVVFDRVLVEEFDPGQEVIYAVRGRPVINDALIEDALVCGIDQRAAVISSGVDAPGTILKYCTEEFRDIFRRADLIISKGQGNFEALSEAPGRIYFLFRAKCPVVAGHADVAVGDLVLIKA